MKSEKEDRRIDVVAVNRLPTLDCATLEVEPHHRRKLARMDGTLKRPVNFFLIFCSIVKYYVQYLNKCVVKFSL